MTLVTGSPLEDHVKVRIVKRFGLWWWSVRTTSVFHDRWGVSRSMPNAIEKIKPVVLSFMKYQQGSIDVRN